MTRPRTVRRTLLTLGAPLLLLATLAVAPPPTPGTTPAGAEAAVDCDDWRYGPADEPASLPPEYDRDDYRRTSLRDERPELFDSPQNHCGQKGAAVDLAWGLSRGTPDVVIAVLDSGIRWRSAGAMADLATEAYLNLGEAEPPCIGEEPDGDCDGDGRFDITDFGPITDRNGNGLADPEDLILDPAFSDGVDDDGNGYVDDISGWDFLYGDNNPLDTVDYGHGTGEALDSTAAENGAGDVGTCPGCRFLPVRVSDSFIADGARFAAGVLFGLDSGADVVQEALGALTNPVHAQQAIDAAYERGVVVVASMADEASEHPNLPAALEHTMAVNSVTEKSNDLLGTPNEGYLALNGCTNFGGHTFVAIPSNACSSEATGQSAGMVGLLESYAREQGIAPHPDLAGGPGDNVLSANEAMQLVRATADDIDFSTPNAVDPANNYGTSTGNPVMDTVRYPSRAGWDATYGYGRVNTYELLRAVGDERIPPEAMIDGPRWFEVLPTDGELVISGRVAAERADTYSVVAEWAPGLEPPAYPATDTWTEIGVGNNLAEAWEGDLFEVDLATIAAALPGGGQGPPIDPTDENRPDVDRHAVRIRLRVTAHGGPGDGLVGEFQKQVFVHDDPDLLDGLPARIESAGTASPVFADLDGAPGDELVLATDAGTIHAYRPDLSEVPGFPVHTHDAPWWPESSPTALEEAIDPYRSAVMLGGPAVGDVDDDGDPEVVAASLDGTVTVWSHTGIELASMGVDPAYSNDDPAQADEYNRTKPGIGAAPALGDLDDDGDLEIVVAALDRHVYAWHDDGTPVDGFPVLLVDPAKADTVDPVTHHVTFLADSGVQEGGELLATPSLGDLDGDGRPEIVVGGQEEYRETPNIGDGEEALALLAAAGSAGNSRVYAISPDGNDAAESPAVVGHPSAQAYLPGWPVKVAMAQTALLPTIGDGVAMPAVIGDVDRGTRGPEVVVASAAGPIYVFGVDGRGVYGATETGDLPLTWSAGTGGGGGVFGENRNSEDLVASFAGFGGPALGQTSGEFLQISAPTAGLTRLIDLLLADRQLPSDDQLSGWSGGTRKPLPGSPQAVADLAFFVQPAIAEIDGDPLAETIAGTSTYTVSAFDALGTAPAGWPKLTGGWSVGTPGVGDWDGDGTLEVAQVVRDGRLYVWGTEGTDDPEWAAWGCDPLHSGRCTDRPLVLDEYCIPGGSPVFFDVREDHPFCFDISWAIAREITEGFGDGNYRPVAPVTRGSMAAFLYRYAGTPPFVPPDEDPTFSDVGVDHPFFAEIEWLVAEGIAGGLPDGTYRPADPITRGSMAAFLYRLAGEPDFVPPASPTFPDVPADHPFFAEIEWLAATGLTGGFDDGTYRPRVAVSRQTMAAFLHRYQLGSPF